MLSLFLNLFLFLHQCGTLVRTGRQTHTSSHTYISSSYSAKVILENKKNNSCIVRTGRGEGENMCFSIKENLSFSKRVSSQ